MPGRCKQVPRSPGGERRVSSCSAVPCRTSACAKRGGGNRIGGESAGLVLFGVVVGGEERQHTFHADFDVKSLATDGKTLVIEQAGWIHTLDPVNGARRRLDINVNGEFPWMQPRWLLWIMCPQRLGWCCRDSCCFLWHQISSWCKSWMT